MKPFLFVLSLMFWQCTAKQAELNNFNFDDFKSDKAACIGKRTQEIETLMAESKKILGLSEKEVYATFGKYDVQVLSRRNKKVLIFFLEKGPQCQQIQNPSQALTMALEINAIGLVEEVLFQKGLPY